MGERDITDTGFDSMPGGPLEPLTIVLSPNAGVIEGSVKNAKDEPAGGALITLIPDADHRSVTRRYKTITTDQNGHFTVKGVIPGEYKIYAWEDMEADAYEDPDFMKPHEADGEAEKHQGKRPPKPTAKADSHRNNGCPHRNRCTDRAIPLLYFVRVYSGEPAADDDRKRTAGAAPP